MLAVKEIKRIRGASRSWGKMVLRPGENPLSKFSAEVFEIQAEIDPGGASQVGFNLRGNPLVYDVKEKSLSCKGKKVNVEPANGAIKLHILVDRTSIEIFPNEGLMPIFLCFPLDTDNRSLEVFARGGQAKIHKLKVWKLKSIWG
jgi:sucrose-6-phosphate hydrolase SacC (GH32 family)